MFEGYEPFHTEVVRCSELRAVLHVFGDVDLVTTAQFELELGSLIDTKPQQLIVDISCAVFVSVTGYQAIGRCSGRVERLAVRAKSSIARRVLDLLGHVEIEVTEDAAPVASRLRNQSMSYCDG